MAKDSKEPNQWSSKRPRTTRPRMHRRCQSLMHRIQHTHRAFFSFTSRPSRKEETVTDRTAAAKQRATTCCQVGARKSGTR